MKLIDTHAHLYLDQFAEDRLAMLERAREKGIQKFYLPNIDQTSIESMLALEKAFPGECFPMMGLHPCSVKEDYEEELGIVRDWLDKRSFCAVGEIGIDLYWDKSFIEQQQKAFIQQAEWAKDLDIPIVIHARESTDMLIQMVKELQDGRLKGIFHCFGGSVEQAKEIIDLGFYLGIGGVVTFKKSGLDQTLSIIGIDHVVLETDAPYLAPVPNRGKRNESAYIFDIAQKVANITGKSLEEVAEQTTRNAETVFQVSLIAK